METKVTLKVIRAGVKRATLCSLPWTHAVQIISKGTIGGRNSSVGSAWARCPQRRGFDPPLGTFFR